MFLCLCCRVRCSALGLLAALKLPGAEIPLIGCSFSGKREGERVQSRARSHDCDKLHSVSRRRRRVRTSNSQRQAAKWNTALAQTQLLSSVYLFGFVLQTTRRPAGSLPEAERRARLAGSRSLCFIIFACFASFPHRRGYAKRLNGFTLPSSGKRSPIPSPRGLFFGGNPPDSPHSRLSELRVFSSKCQPPLDRRGCPPRVICLQACCLTGSAQKR